MIVYVCNPAGDEEQMGSNRMVSQAQQNPLNSLR
jgi:hypothetical protein